MSTGNMVNEGFANLGTWYLKNSQSSRGANSLYVGLYTNTTKPLVTSTLASGLSELGLAGYSRIQISDGDWSNVLGLFTNLQKTFTAGEDWLAIYGAFICDIAASTSGLLIDVDHFTNGPFFIGNGLTFKVTPQINFTKQA